MELFCGGGHDGLRVEVCLGEGGALCAFVHNDDAVGKAGEFGQFGGDEQNGGAFGSELADDAVDFVFRADVHAARRFVEDEDVRIGAEPFSEDDFLLVAAGEGCRCRFERSGTDGKPGDFALRRLFFGGKAQKAEAGGKAFQRRHADVAADGVAEDKPLFFAVFGDEADAVVDGFYRIFDVHGFVIEADGAARGHHAEDGVHHFGTACADEPEETEDFAGMHSEVDVAEGVGMAEMLHFQRGRDAVCGRCLRQTRRVHLFHPPSDHKADEFVHRGFFARQGGDVFAVAHHSDGVGEAHDFFHAVRDVDDGFPLQHRKVRRSVRQG